MLQTRDYLTAQWIKTRPPGTTRPTLYNKRVGSLSSPANQNNEDAGDWAKGLSSLSVKTRISNHL